jgi:hypothetical protein
MNIPDVVRRWGAKKAEMCAVRSPSPQHPPVARGRVRQVSRAALQRKERSARDSQVGIEYYRHSSNYNGNYGKVGI